MLAFRDLAPTPCKKIAVDPAAEILVVLPAREIAKLCTVELSFLSDQHRCSRCYRRVQNRTPPTKVISQFCPWARRRFARADGKTTLAQAGHDAFKPTHDDQNYHWEGDRPARSVRSLVTGWDGTCRFEPTAIFGCSESSDRIGLRPRQLARRLAAGSNSLRLEGKARHRRRAHCRRDQNGVRALEAVFPVGGVRKHSSFRWRSYHPRHE